MAATLAPSVVVPSDASAVTAPSVVPTTVAGVVPAAAAGVAPGAAAGAVLFGAGVPANNTGSLYVGDLSSDVTEATLFEMFNSVGPVASVRLCRDATSRRSLGYGYINFLRSDDAERAIDTLNFKEIRGRQCRIMWSHRDPTLRRTGKGNIYVKNLDKTIDNKTLYDTFSMFGDILSCKVASDAEKNSLGYGFVHFASDESALKAIERTNGKQIGDSVVQVMPFKTRQEREAANPQRFNNLYVKHFPASATVESVKALFAPYGTVTSCHLPVNGEGKLVGFGFVCFATADEAVAALKALNETEVEGTKLYVSRHQKKDEREKEMREKRERQRFERLRKFANVNLYVKNLSPEMTDERLKQIFAEHGNITSARVMRDQAGASRQFGFVCFSAPEEATKAVTSLNGFIVDGKPLYVTLAQQKDARRQQLEMARMNRMQFIQPQMQPQMPNGQIPFVNMGQMMFPGMPQQRFAAYPQQAMPLVQGLPQRWAPQQQQAGMPMMGMPRSFPMGPRGMPGAVPMHQGVQSIMAAPGMQQPGQPGGPRGPAQGGNRGPKGPRGGVAGPQGVVPQQGVVQPTMVMGLPQQGGPIPMVGPKPVAAAPGPQGQLLYAEVVRAESAAHAHMAAAAAAAAQSAQVAAPVAVPVPVEAVMPSAAELAAAPEEVRKQMIGERLYPRVSLAVAPELAGKITGMLIEMDVAEVLHLLDSQAALDAKIQEALAVLRQHNSAA